MAKRLFELPIDLIRHIFAELLLIEEVGNFDSAISQTKERVDFLHILQTTPFHLILKGNFPPMNDTPIFWKWLNIRKVATSNLYVQNEYIDFILNRPADWCSHIQTLFFIESTEMEDIRMGKLINSCHNLETVTFSCCRLNEETFEALAKSTKLKEVYFDTPISTAGLGQGSLPYSTIGECSNIKRIHFTSCMKAELRLCRSDIQAMSLGCPNLVALNFHFCQFLNFVDLVESIDANPHLESLDIGDIQHARINSKVLTDRDIRLLIIKFPNLRSLGLSNFRKLSDCNLSLIVVGFPLLKHLDISHCTNLTSWGSLKQIPLRLTCLESLDVSGTEISKDVVLHLVQSCRHLVKLVLGWSCDDSILVGLGQHCPQLRELRVDQRIRKDHTWCKYEWQITVTGVISLLRNCRSLESLILISCDMISSSDLARIAETTKNCKLLKELNFEKCNPMPLEGILSLVWNCTKLHRLSFPYRHVDIGKVCRLFSRNAPAFRLLRHSAQRYEGYSAHATALFIPSGMTITCGNQSQNYYSRFEAEVPIVGTHLPLSLSEDVKHCYVFDSNGERRARLTINRDVDFVQTIQLQVEEQTGVKPAMQLLELQVEDGSFKGLLPIDRESLGLLSYIRLTKVVQQVKRTNIVMNFALKSSLIGKCF